MSSFQIVTCEEKEYACGSAFLTWQDDCKCFRAKIESDPKPELFKKFGMDLQIALQKAIGGPITQLSVDSVNDQLGTALAASGIYDDCSSSVLAAQSGLTSPQLQAAVPAISVGGIQMIERFKLLLKAVVTYEGDLKGGVVKVATCVSECAKLGSLTTTITFVGPFNTVEEQANRLTLSTASLVTLCDCGARPKALNGSTILLSVN